MDTKIFAAKLAEKRITHKEMCDAIRMRPQRLSDMLAGRLDGWKYRHRIALFLGLRDEELFPDEFSQIGRKHKIQHLKKQ